MGFIKKVPSFCDCKIKQINACELMALLNYAIFSKCFAFAKNVKKNVLFKQTTIKLNDKIDLKTNGNNRKRPKCMKSTRININKLYAHVCGLIRNKNDRTIKHLPVVTIYTIYTHSYIFTVLLSTTTEY